MASRSSCFTVWRFRFFAFAKPPPSNCMSASFAGSSSTSSSTYSKSSSILASKSLNARTSMKSPFFFGKLSHMSSSSSSARSSDESISSISEISLSDSKDNRLFSSHACLKSCVISTFSLPPPADGVARPSVLGPIGLSSSYSVPYSSSGAFPAFLACSSSNCFHKGFSGTGTLSVRVPYLISCLGLRTLVLKSCTFTPIAGASSKSCSSLRLRRSSASRSSSNNSDGGATASCQRNAS
mmetsp:Transcript_52738/g.115053  ORF Transcript_52738/g.115053 Transcript_52738/m.115053 type:complete len:239 (-) Transcript_52738:521-1237(-)